MGKGRKGSERTERLRALYEAGDHGAARRLAAELLADSTAAEDEHDLAQEVRARTAPDRLVVIAGFCGAAAALVIAVWQLLH